eukprot:TRINITY_DN81332_c0_g1_i1.p1 TRINITY_DN81332_c0_g1~~TRINITY_DN81332_c0_g1_i1.p1  ORF type:complete len:403 (+),score=55.87 TRINITY_DN81332_c0_g1_i1:64-1272(+)
MMLPRGSHGMCSSLRCTAATPRDMLLGSSRVCKSVGHGSSQAASSVINTCIRSPQLKLRAPALCWSLAAASSFGTTVGFARRRAAYSLTKHFGNKASDARAGGPSQTDSAYDIPEHGYSLLPGPDGTGGWLQHRSVLTEPGSGPGGDWIREVFDDPDNTVGTDLGTASAFARSPALQMRHKPHILVLYGSLRETSFSRSLAYECARLLECLGADVRVFNPQGLPVRDPTLEEHPKVQELRALSLWSEGHVWVSPEMHGCVTGTFKNQIDWLPLNTGSVRPTQGRTCAVLQVNGGSQSFNVVNELRRLARWMRMPCCTNQSSIPKAWQEFENGRMKASSFRDRVVDVMEEYFKFTLIMREHADFLVDRYSERKEIVEKGRLLTQAEKESLKDEAAAEAAAGKR